MKTKIQLWDEVAGLLDIKQYDQLTKIRKSRTYDAQLKAAMKVSKSKKIHQLCLEGLNSPIQYRYSLMGVKLNSFGNQIIKIYDYEIHDSFTITNKEGSHEDASIAVEYLNRNSLS